MTKEQQEIVKRLKTQGFGICHEAATLIEQQAKELADASEQRSLANFDSNAANLQYELKIAEQAKEIEELKACMDIDICRLQLPDGTVPTDTVSCARAWHREANRFWRERDTLRTQNERLVKALDACLPYMHKTQFEEAKALLAEVKLTPPASIAPSRVISSTSLLSHQASDGPAE